MLRRWPIIVIWSRHLLLTAVLQSTFRLIHAVPWSQREFPAPAASSSNSKWRYLPLQPLVTGYNNDNFLQFDLVDMDMDGDEDLVAMCRKFLHWWENDPTDLLRHHIINVTTEVQLPASKFADMDSDGDKDLVFFPGLNDSPDTPQAVFWFEHLGSNRWNETAHSVATVDFAGLTCSGSVMEVFDANLDGRQDVFRGCFDPITEVPWSGWLMSHEDDYTLERASLQTSMATHTMTWLRHNTS